MKFGLARMVLLFAFASVLPAGEPSLVPDAPSTVPDYFCTWNVQGFACSYTNASKPLWKFKVTPQTRAVAPDIWLEFNTQGDLYRTYDVHVSVSIAETIRRIAEFLAKEDPKDQRLINCEDDVYIGAGFQLIEFWALALAGIRLRWTRGPCAARHARSRSGNRPAVSSRPPDCCPNRPSSFR